MARFALGSAAALLVGALSLPVQAGDIDPVGQWEVDTGESRYRVSYCGDGTELCAKMIWLREDARTPENLALLNSYVVRGARLGEDRSWSGTVLYNGQSYASTVTLISNDSMRVESCAGFICRSFGLNRLQPSALR
jgi:uncharacterized protein (DUF2147 family)